MREPTEDEVRSLRYQQLNEKVHCYTVAIAVLERERDAIKDEMEELEAELDKELPF